MFTPWGSSQHIKSEPGGCVLVDTAGHGGIGVPVKLAQTMPAAALAWARSWAPDGGGYVWFEEDVCCLAVGMFLPANWAALGCKGSPAECLEHARNWAPAGVLAAAGMAA